MCPKPAFISCSCLARVPCLLVLSVPQPVRVQSNPSIFARAAVIYTAANSCKPKPLCCTLPNVHERAQNYDGTWHSTSVSAPYRPPWKLSKQRPSTATKAAVLRRVYSYKVRRQVLGTQSGEVVHILPDLARPHAPTARVALASQAPQTCCTRLRQ